MRYFAGIDVGTSAIKAAVFSEKGELKALSVKEYQLLTPSDGYVELPPDNYRTLAFAALREAAAKSGVRREDLIGVSVSSQGQSFVMLDENDRPLRNVIVWLDTRALKEVEILAKRFTRQEYFHRTGVPSITAVSTLPKLMWLRAHEPEILDRTKHFFLLEDYIIHLLSGERATDPVVGMSTAMYEVEKFAWWREAFEIVGLEMEQFPRIMRSGEVAGNVLPSVADELGISREALVCVGSLDQTAGAVGAGNVDAATVTETTGTALAVVVTTERLIFDPQFRVICGAHPVPGKWWVLPYAQTAGMAFKWFRDALGNGASYDDLTALAAKVPIGSEGLTALPHLTGKACPDFNAAARAAFVGIGLHHTRAHFARAMMECIAFSLKELLDVASELGARVKRVRSMGGGARSDFWLQMKADLLGLPIEVPACEETACLGDAIFAMVGTGTYRSIEEASRAVVKVARRFEPDPKNFAAYHDAYVRFEEAYRKLYGR
jgi:xylulokinase